MKRTATIIAINKKSLVIPNATHSAHVRVVTDQANMTMAMTFLELIVVVYHVENAKARYWFTDIPKTDQKDANMQIMDAATFSN